MKGVAVVSKKGGVGKTALAHALALGAAWHHIPAYLMHTDDRTPLTVHGRPYMYYDARKPEALQTLMSAALNEDGLCVIDSGGNRPEFDTWIAESVDLVLVPVTPDREAVREGMAHLERLEQAGAKNARFIINMYPSNPNERRYVARYFDALPGEKIMGRIDSVRAIRTLSEDDHPKFVTPSSKVNNLARTLYRQVRDTLEKQALRAGEVKKTA